MHVSPEVTHADRADAHAFDHAGAPAELDHVADRDGVFEQDEGARDDVFDQALCAEAHREPHDARAREQRTDVDAELGEDYQGDEHEQHDANDVSHQRQEGADPRPALYQLALLVALLGRQFDRAGDMTTMGRPGRVVTIWAAPLGSRSLESLPENGGRTPRAERFSLAGRCGTGPVFLFSLEKWNADRFRRRGFRTGRSTKMENDLHGTCMGAIAVDGTSPGPAMECSIVDVFAERPLAGNQLAVVRGCAHLDTAEMQAIAREMNFSESTFVVEERPEEAQVRIFTPVRDLPFAGHPTLGTAWVLGRDRGAYSLDLAAGRIPVTFEADGVVWMEPPPVDLGDTLDSGRAAALLGLDESDLDSRYPSRFATVGPWFALIGVRTLDALRRIAVAPMVYEDVAEGGWLAVFAFAEEPYNHDANFAARMLIPFNGIREDPATGSANTAFAAHLRSLGVGGRIVVEQGFEIERPSRLYLDVADPIRVGGKVHPVLTGTLDYWPARPNENDE